MADNVSKSKCGSPALVVNLITIAGCINDVQPKLDSIFRDNCVKFIQRTLSG
jgi:hypothetical protein